MHPHNPVITSRHTSKLLNQRDHNQRHHLVLTKQLLPFLIKSKESGWRLLGAEQHSSPFRIYGWTLLQWFNLTPFIIYYLVIQLSGYAFNASWIFSFEFVELNNAKGLLLFFLWLFDSLLCVLFETFVVGRSKLAWDFALTVHIINLIAVQLYCGKFPTSILWWRLQILSGVILETLSSDSTWWNELRSTFFGNISELQELREVRHEEFEMKKKIATSAQWSSINWEHQLSP